MSPITEPSVILDVRDVVKVFGGLRPLRLKKLRLEAGDCIAVAGLDAPAAEVLVKLLTGASLPDSGTIEVLGRRTTAITDESDWLAWLDHFGIVSNRAVLLESSTLAQNLALPFTLEIEPVPPDIAE